MAVSLFKAFEYSQNVSICQAQFKETESWLQPDSAYQDRAVPVREDGSIDPNETDLILIEPTPGQIVQFEEQYADFDERGVAVITAADNRKWALRLRMYKPITEQEVREYQVRQLISR